MNILDYAPVEFQEHLKALDNTVKFYKVRLRCEVMRASAFPKLLMKYVIV